MNLIMLDDILELSVCIDIQTILDCSIQLASFILTRAYFERVLVLFPDLRFCALVPKLECLLDMFLHS